VKIRSLVLLFVHVKADVDPSEHAFNFQRNICLIYGYQDECVSACVFLSVAVLNTRQRVSQILPRGATYTKYGREGGSGKCALWFFDKCCNVATGRSSMFLSVLPSSHYILLPKHFSVFPSSHLAEVMSIAITLSRDKSLWWLEVSKLIHP
jgi:uncharacterized protein YerC